MILDLLISPANAASGPGIGGFDYMQFLPLVLIFVAFYFFLIRPQQKKAQKQREMLSALNRGDQVITSGGIIGKIAKVLDDNEVLVEIADNVEVRVVRSMISENLSQRGTQTADVKPIASGKRRPTSKTTKKRTAVTSARKT